MNKATRILMLFVLAPMCSGQSFDPPVNGVKLKSDKVVTWADDTDTTISHPGAGTIDLNCNGVRRLRATPAGVTLSGTVVGAGFDGDFLGHDGYDSTRAFVGFSEPLLITAGSLPSGVYGLELTATPANSGTQHGVKFTTTAPTSSGSMTLQAVQSGLSGLNYTGAGQLVALYAFNSVPGTGTGYFAGTSGNFGAKFEATSVGAGTNLADYNATSGSTGLNIGSFNKAVSAGTGKNVGLMSVGRNTSGVAVGAYIGMDSADPSSNLTNTALLVSNSNQAVPIVIFRDNTTDVFRIEDGGAITATGVMTTGGLITSGTYGWSGDADTYIGHPAADTVGITVAGIMTISALPESGAGTGLTRARIANGDGQYVDYWERYGTSYMTASQHLDISSGWYGYLALGQDTFGGPGSRGVLIDLNHVGIEHPLTLGNSIGEAYGRITLFKGVSANSSTPLELSQDGSGTGKITVTDSDTAHRYRADITMFATAGDNAGKAAAYTLEFLLKNVGGTVSQVGPSYITTIADDVGGDPPAWSVDVGDISGTTVNVTTAADAGSTVVSRAFITEVGTQ